MLDDPAWKDVRVISVNSEQCNEMNWYLWSALGDPNNEIAWLEGELKNAEEKNEKVLLIAHFPSVSCNHAFGARIQALTERYQHLIRLQLYGHSHDEQWYMNRGKKDGKPIAVQFGNPSLGTRGGKNPGFRVLTLDAETMLPIEVTRYYLNLTEANNGNPKWQKMYDVTEEYGFKSLKPSDYDQVVKSFSTGNVETLKRMISNEDGRFEFKSAKEVNCDQHCIKYHTCRKSSSEYWERQNCLGDFHYYDFVRNVEGAFENMMVDNWVEGPKPE